MVGTTLHQQLRNFVETLQDQEILDHNFDYIVNMQCEDDPNFITDMISLFLDDADASIAELAKQLEAPVVDFPTMIGFVHQLRGSSGSMGGLRMTIACAELRLAADNHDTLRCFALFERVKDEYRTLQENFNHIMQIAYAISANYARRRRG